MVLPAAWEKYRDSRSSQTPSRSSRSCEISSRKALLGADICIEEAGVPETVARCFMVLKTGGTVVFNGKQTPMTLSPSEDFIRRDVRAVGSWYYHFFKDRRTMFVYQMGRSRSLPIDVMRRATRKLK